MIQIQIFKNTLEKFIKIMNIWDDIEAQKFFSKERKEKKIFIQEKIFSYREFYLKIVQYLILDVPKVVFIKYSNLL